jgi:hypothetical protein
MADPRAFISFDFDNNETQRMLIVGQSRNSKTPFSVQDWSSKEELVQSQWETVITDKINKCHLMVVLVGRSTYGATGVLREIKMAQAQDIPFFGIYVDGAGTSTSLPGGLARNRTISWTRDSISSAIDQMMKEGKNVG